MKPLVFLLGLIQYANGFFSLSHSLTASKFSGLYMADKDWGGPLAAECNFAAECVTKAVSLCREVQESLATAKDQSDTLGTTIESKDDLNVKADDTPVTAADFAIQGFVAAELSRSFPDVKFMGEEDADALRTDKDLCEAARSMAAKLSGDSSPSTADFIQAVDRGIEDFTPSKERYWVLDPIDGTKGLITGQQYVVGLSLIDVNGEVLVGAMGNPAASPSVLVAAKDQGAQFYTEEGKFEDLPSAGPSWSHRKYEYSRFDSSSTNDDEDEDDWGCGVEEAGVDYPPFLLSRPMSEGSPLPFGPCCAPSDICCGAMVKYWAVATGQAAGFVQFQTKLKTVSTF
jgi:3'(2'), 5'-bisphosphate nucleotidase